MSGQLFIRGGAIGDFILTLPILEALRAREPGAEVHILGYPHIAELGVGRRHAAAVRRVDAPEWAPLFSRGSALAAAEREYLRGFDRVICVWPDEDATIRDNLLAAGVWALLAVNPMPPAGCVVHAIEHVACQCERGGLPLAWLEPHLYPSERDRWWVERYMRVTGAGSAPLLGLAPGSGSPAKNWPAEGFAALVEYWWKKKGNVLVFAGPADEEALASLRALLSENAGNLFFVQGESLPRVAALMERCELFVGNDSGPAHLAAAVRTPAVAVFGPTDPAVWRPLAPRVAVVAPTAGGSISDITSTQVIEAMEELLRI